MVWRFGVLTLAAVAGLLTAAAVTPVAAQIGGRPARPVVIPPKGPVRQVIFKNCTSCHGIDDYAFNAFDRAGWDSYIDAKHQGLDVALAGNDRELLLDWLVTEFGPGTKPFPRTYVAREVTTGFLSDADGEAQARCPRKLGFERFEFRTEDEPAAGDDAVDRVADGVGVGAWRERHEGQRRGHDVLSSPSASTYRAKCRS